MKKIKFNKKWPLYYGIISRLKVVDDRTIAIAGVSMTGGECYLHINLDYFTSPRMKFLSGILRHEIYHLFFHLCDPAIAEARITNPLLLNIAAEASCNEFIRKRDLPPVPITLADYRKFGFRPKQSTIERFHLLMKAHCEGILDIPSPQFSDTHFDPPDDRDGAFSARSSMADILRDAITEALGKWEDAGHDTPPDMTIGDMPAADILALIEPRPNAPGVDWKTELSMFVARLAISDEIVTTFRRPNRRFPERIDVPGHFHPARNALPRIVLAIDTSGSIDEQMLAVFTAEIDRLFPHTSGMEVVMCDDRIRKVFTYEGTIKMYHGRGGTSFLPVFDPKFLSRFSQVDGLVYITDGFDGGEIASAPPPPFAVLWVFPSRQACASFSCPWGGRTVIERR